MTTFTSTLVPMFTPNDPVVQVNNLASPQILLIGTGATNSYSPFLAGGATGTLQYGSVSGTFSVDNTTTPIDLANALSGILGIYGSCDVVSRVDGIYLVMAGFNSGSEHTFNISMTPDTPDDISNATGFIVTSTAGTDGQPSTVTGNWTQYSPAQDASITVNGVSYNGPTNSFAAVIPGFVIKIAEQD